MASEPLVCPSCASSHPLEERFCPRCGTPLVFSTALDADLPVTARQERARKIKPQYAEGELVRVAGARHLAEAELIQGMLLEEGVPSMLKRTRGFDVPDYLAAGPRDVLVPASGADVAREVLNSAELGAPAAEVGGPPAGRLLASLVAGAALIALIVWIGSRLGG